VYRNLLLCITLSATLGAAAWAQEGWEKDDRDIMPLGRGVGTAKHPGPSSDTPGEARSNNKPGLGNGIYYHGGPVMTATKNVYYIWYGNWSGNTATSILTTLAQSIGGSPYFNINTTYTNLTGMSVSNSVAYKGSTTDNYSLGKSLSDANIATIVANAIGGGKLALDVNGVYFVLTSADVNETSGFCTQYCGWHTYGTMNNTPVKYAFIGNPDRCPSACEAQSNSPNGNPGADGMASIISHELEEASTDPQLNAWYDRSGAENADKCAWTFGATKTAPNGSAYNMTLGGLNFLIQRNWVNANGGFCALSY
jgi:hypothetical protein